MLKNILLILTMFTLWLASLVYIVPKINDLINSTDSLISLSGIVTFISLCWLYLIYYEMCKKIYNKLQ